MCEASATSDGKGEEKRKPDQRMQHRGRDDHQQRASHLGARIEALQQPVPARQILCLHGMGEGMEEMGGGRETRAPLLASGRRCPKDR